MTWSKATIEIATKVYLTTKVISA